jgi:Raf kinase inhibitor-like YbhB/YbcL family protein
MATITETISNTGKLVRHTIGAALSGVHAGDEKLASQQAATRASSTMRLSSTGFTDGGLIPEKYTPQGENLSPALSWSGVPAGAEELVLIVEDPDAPFPNPFVHWILHGLSPSVTSLPAAIPTDPVLQAFGGAVQGKNDAKSVGWYGPKPPMGHGIHHYHFQLFALDARFHLGPDATLADLKKAMAGHVISDGEIIGTFERTSATK